MNVEAAERYRLLDLISLDPGSWGEWFSGTMSALAVMVALGGFLFSEWRLHRDAKRLEERHARKLGTKLAVAADQLIKINEHFVGSRAGAGLAEDAPLSWEIVYPLIGIPEVADLQLDEFENDLLIRAGAFDFMQKAIAIFSTVKTVRFVLTEYAVRRQAVFDRLPPPTRKNGELWTHTLSEQDLAPILPLANVLNNLIESADGQCTRALASLRDVSGSYNEIMKAYFKKDSWYGFTVDAPLPEGARS